MNTIKTEVELPAVFQVSGKSGQERDGKKLKGGVMYNLEIPGEEAAELISAVLKLNPGKLTQLLFAYGLTATAQDKVGYQIPGAELWEDGKKATLKKWGSEDTEDFVTALRAYDSLESDRAGEVNTVELRGFFRAMFGIGQSFEQAWGLAKAQKVRNSEDEGLARKVWEKVEAGL